MVIQEKNQTSFAEVILEQTPGLFFVVQDISSRDMLKNKNKKYHGTVEP